MPGKYTQEQWDEIVPSRIIYGQPIVFETVIGPDGEIISDRWHREPKELPAQGPDEAAVQNVEGGAFGIPRT